MVRGNGVDIIEISRIRKAVEKNRAFLERVFTPGEQEECLGRKQSWASLAARFAAKEAVAKAFGTGIGRVNWTDIEIVTEESGRPRVVLHGQAKKLAGEMGIEALSLSLSHCRNHAIAFVIAE